MPAASGRSCAPVQSQGASRNCACAGFASAATGSTSWRSGVVSFRSKRAGSGSAPVLTQQMGCGFAQTGFEIIGSLQAGRRGAVRLSGDPLPADWPGTGQPRRPVRCCDPGDRPHPGLRAGLSFSSPVFGLGAVRSRRRCAAGGGPAGAGRGSIRLRIQAFCRSCIREKGAAVGPRATARFPSVGRTQVSGR